MRTSLLVAIVAIFGLLIIAPPGVQAQSATPLLTIDSPMPYQVFQRQTPRQGLIAVRGQPNLNGEPVDSHYAFDHVGVCVEPETNAPGDAELADCPRIHCDRATRAFSGMVVAPAGGFYRVELHLMHRGKQVGEQVVEHVGVGEVFVVAGQSNSTNYGEERQTVKSGYVTTFDGKQWRIADDPQPGVQDASSKGSFIPPFGDAMYAKFRVPIGIASVGHGSTSVRQWLPKGERFATQPTMTKFATEIGPGVWEPNGVLYSGLMERIRELDGYAPHNRQGFRALLWHQGESDAHQKPPHDISGAEYRRLMTELIHASRTDAGWSFSWFVAQVSYHTPDDPMAPEIREAQASLWQSGLALEGPDTDQLTGLNRQNHGQGVHMSDMGLKAHGQLWADKVSAWLEKTRNEKKGDRD